jgi:hypothetical protein
MSNILQYNILNHDDFGYYQYHPFYVLGKIKLGKGLHKMMTS